MIRYSIDGIDLQNLGVTVRKAKGLFDLPKLKDPVKTSWPTRHGIMVDLSQPVYDVREITLECAMKADSRLSFLTRLNSIIYTHLYKPNLRQLRVDLVDGKPLHYYCYMQDGIDVELATRWNEANHVGLFTLKLIEPEPFKRVYRFEAGEQLQLSLQFDTTSQFTIYWGDGSTSTVTSGTTSANHLYDTQGTHYIALVGMVNEIINLESYPNIELVWNLQ